MDNWHRYGDAPDYLRAYPGCPAPVRLRALRAKNPADWRKARAYGFHNWHVAFCAGLHQGVGQWYSHGGEQFRDERFADECEGGPDHNGWFTNADGETYKDGSGLARGIVGRLPHGRFVAGYHCGNNGERVYFTEVFDSERDAAHAADSHAEHFADSAREDSERFNAIVDAEGHAESMEWDTRMAYAARNVSASHREYARDRIEELRAARADVEKARLAYEGA